MRWFHLTIVVLFIAVMIVFAIQNREVVTMEFLGFGIRAPLALVAAGFYALGAITGVGLFALLRRSIGSVTADANFTALPLKARPGAATGGWPRRAC